LFFFIIICIWTRHLLCLEIGYKFIAKEKLKSEHDGNGLNKTSIQQLKPCS